MYIGDQIWRRFKRNSKWAVGRVSAQTIKEEVQKMIAPYGAKAELFLKKFSNKKHWFMIGGEFAPDVLRRPITIELCVNADKGYVYFTQARRERFIFLLNQTLQHELVHKLQFTNRGGNNFYTHHYYFTPGNSKSSPRTLEYLAMVEEIDAYAHDLAMEIKYYYPLDDPKQVLKHINDYIDLPTWKIYSRAFKRARWPNVRNELLRRTYRWLPHIQEKFL